MFWLCLLGVIAAVVFVLLWLKTNGFLDGKKAETKTVSNTAR